MQELDKSFARERLPDDPKKSVIFAILENGHVLLEERIKIDSSYSGCVLIPGGRFKVGETAIEALKGEAFEECNVIPTEYKLVGIIRNFKSLSGNSLDQHIFVVTKWNGEIYNKEHHKARHLRVTLKKAIDVCHESCREILQLITDEVSA